MMLRLIRSLVLVLAGGSLLLITLAGLAGQLIPSGDQTVFTEALPDQRTRVALVALDRRLAIDRVLPVRLNSLRWLADGSRLLLSGVRNEQMRLYELGYDPASPWTTWAGTLPEDVGYSAWFGLSPDGRSLALPGSGTGDLELIPFDAAGITLAATTYESTTRTNPSGSRINSLWWTPDSRFVTYFYYAVSETPVGSLPYADNILYVLEAATGERREIARNPRRIVGLSPDNTALLYELGSEPLLPSSVMRDYSSSGDLYWYDLAAGTSRKIASETMLRYFFSPDGRWLAYLTPPADGRYYPQPIRRLESSSTHTQQFMADFSQYNPDSLAPPRHLAGYFVAFPYGIWQSYSGVPDDAEAYVLDLQTGHSQRIAPEPGITYSDIQWSHDSEHLLVTYYETESTRQTTSPPGGFILTPGSSLGMYPTYSTPEYRSAFLDIHTLDQPPQPLTYEDRPLVLMQSLSVGNQMLLREADSAATAAGGSLFSGRLVVLDMTTGAFTPMQIGANEQVDSVYPSPDGRFVVLNVLIGAAPPATTLVPMTGGPPVNPVPTATPGPGAVPTVAVYGGLPPTNPTGWRIAVLDTLTGVLRPLAFTGRPYEIFWSPDGQAALYFRDELTSVGTRHILYRVDLRAEGELREVSVFVMSPTVQPYGIGSTLWRPQPDQAS